MNVLYTCDNNYIWIMGISAISLFENSKNIGELTVYLLGENISQESKNILLNIGEKYGRNITIIDVPELDIPESLISARWPLSAFTRLYAGQLLPTDITRVLYLDCDTIVTGDISPLENIMIEDYIVCGIKDCIGSAYKENIGLNGDDVYINAGVLLMNLIKLRHVDVKSVIEDYMYNYEKKINYADQDILNGVFNKKIGVLPPQYNVMTIDIVHSYKEIKMLRDPTNFYTSSELAEAVEHPVIIHYTTNMRVIRPWFSNTDHPLAFEFKKYMKISPWANRSLNKMEFKSKETKIIGMIDKWPKVLSYRILGLMHAKLKPIYIRIKARTRNK